LGGGQAGESLLPARVALTTIAVLALTDNDIRRDITDGQRSLPPLASALTHRHTGVRYAACQCVRALLRSTDTRTSLVDPGPGAALFAVFTKEDEDRRVVHAALTAVCNLVSQYSPLRTLFLKQGVAPHLACLLALKIRCITINVTNVVAVKINKECFYLYSIMCENG
jgi:armadillo repeat-containing protein 8